MPALFVSVVILNVKFMFKFLNTSTDHMPARTEVTATAAISLVRMIAEILSSLEKTLLALTLDTIQREKIFLLQV